MSTLLASIPPDAIWIGLILLLIMMVYLLRRVSHLERKVTVLWRQANLLSGNHLPASDYVKTLIQSGQKIAAIKAYRRETGTGLKEAKAAIEFIEKSL